MKPLEINQLEMKRLLTVLITAILGPFVYVAYGQLLWSYGGGLFATYWSIPPTAITLWLIYKGLRKMG